MVRFHRIRALCPLYRQELLPWCRRHHGGRQGVPRVRARLRHPSARRDPARRLRRPGRPQGRADPDHHADGGRHAGHRGGANLCGNRHRAPRSCCWSDARCRVFSAGGEVGGAVAFLVEHAPPKQKGKYASWLQASMAISNIIRRAGRLRGHVAVDPGSDRRLGLADPVRDRAADRPRSGCGCARPWRRPRCSATRSSAK